MWGEVCIFSSAMKLLFSLFVIFVVGAFSVLFFGMPSFYYTYFSAEGTSENVLKMKEERGMTMLFLGDSPDWEMSCLPGSPLTVEEWAKELSATAVFNGAFFDTANRPLGKGVYDGVAFDTESDYPVSIGVLPSGEWYMDKGEENTRLYTSGTSTFPLLVENGEVLFTKETQKYGRRTIVAQNEEGWWAVFLTDYPSLFQSAHSLQSLGFTDAINLDGGPSTGLYTHEKSIPSAPVVCVFWR